MAQCCHKKKTNNLTSGVTVFLQHCAGGAYQVTGSVVERNWWFHHCQLCLGAYFQGDLQEVTSCLPTVGSCQQFLYLIQQGLVNNFQITWLLLFTRLTINVQSPCRKTDEIFLLPLTVSWVKGKDPWHEKREPHKLTTVL